MNLETKICKKCNQEKELGKFNVDKKQNKRVNICRKCYQLKYFPQKDRFTWKKATYEQKIERLKTQYGMIAVACFKVEILLSINKLFKE
mgnify:CR=1 FL=1